ncbi:carbohydrate-binding module family 20 protein [Melanomma pulvis-pyrius CBS 109.77]|uniref:Glucoamylase n=1 Tax=Melanomma pulvis-pyrius CBS 109.77 TaxID=1314802 RepID=A0A6A6X0Y8_9PLEO|nr:carbohydrate-binding module family 20 protein [Melanomma pulvis-pyrius CBS 109.77]
MFHSTLLYTLPVALLLARTVFSSPANEPSVIDEFITTQGNISIHGIIANMGPDGAKAPDAPAGIVVASPSRSDPDYYSTWTRDSALTYKALIERFIAGDTSLQTRINEYVSSQAYIQGLSNPSGDPDSGGLGDPRFNVDRTTFTGGWARPQRDGPALRTTALSIYANWLIDHDGQTQALDTIWPIIEKDLAYTVRYWNQTGFDLWEETYGSSFFTLSASHRALVEGTTLAKRLSQPCPGCESAAPQVLCFIQSFWTGSYIDTNINTNEANEAHTGKDASSILSSIHTFDPAAKCTDATFQPCSSRALANHKAVTDSFRSVYSINNGIDQGRAVAVGRYSEDLYYGGNPWYLTTLAAAEQLYDAIIQWSHQDSVIVTDLSLPFFRDLLPSIATGTYESGSSTYGSIISAVSTYADDFIAMVQKYTPPNGGLAEQYDRNTGSPLSAVDLTWSYASFLTTSHRRARKVGPTWGEPTSNTPPTTCLGALACSARITFNTHVTNSFHENVTIVGQLDQIGNWGPENGIRLDGSKYTSSDPLWYGDIDLPAGTPFEYKYIKWTSSGEIVWESGSNRKYTPPLECGSSGIVNDLWT